MVLLLALLVSALVSNELAMALILVLLYGGPQVPTSRKPTTVVLCVFWTLALVGHLIVAAGLDYITGCRSSLSMVTHWRITMMRYPCRGVTKRTAWSRAVKICRVFEIKLYRLVICYRCILVDSCCASCPHRRRKLGRSGPSLSSKAGPGPLAFALVGPSRFVINGFVLRCWYF